jgi:hypothetical protein
MINKSTVDAVVAILKSLEVDGETMEYIIEQVGMTDQMIKQLYHDKPQSRFKIGDRITWRNKNATVIGFPNDGGGGLKIQLDGEIGTRYIDDNECEKQ